MPSSSAASSWATSATSRTDARVLLAILERGGPIAAWLRERGVDDAAVRRLL